MIAYLEGAIHEKSTEFVILKTNGVGYFIEIPISTYYELPEIGKEVSLHILTLVREDSIRLFGFYRRQEKEIFEILLGISRVGPKLALNILSGMELGRLKKAILTEDIHALASIPGLGKKTAERIIFEIRGKKDVMAMLSQSDESVEISYDRDKAEVISILQNLGYKQHLAERALKQVLSETEENLPLDQLIKASLKVLSGR